MKKSVVVLGVVVAAGIGGVLYANHKAEKIIEEQIMLANQSYQEMAAEGLAPALKLGYESLSANVLTRRFTITGLDISLAEMGGVFRIEKLVVDGLDLHGLSDEGGMTFEGARLGNALLVMVPPGALSELVKSITISGDYDYRYTPENGELYFTQETRINNEFSIRYNVTLTQLQDVWQYASQVNELPAEERHQVAASEEYLANVGDKLVNAGISHGELVIRNTGFIERVFETTHAAYLSPSLAEAQQNMLKNMQDVTILPDDLKAALSQFVQQPEQLKATFRFEQPLQFSQMQDEGIVQQFSAPAQFIEFTNLKVEAN